MNISITGLSGFLGQNLITYFENTTSKIKTISRQDLILLNSSLFVSQDAIIHLAGKAHDLKKTCDPNDYYKINFDLTKNLYDNFIKSDAKKFIFLSSVKAAADNVVDILDENVQANPKTHYGKSKLMAEEYIQAQKLPEGKNFYILRPCMIHGPGNKGNLNLLYRFVSKNIPYPLAAFENKRSFLSVKNLCFVIDEIIQRKDIPSGIYNVADDDVLSTNEVVTILSNSINKNPKLLAIPRLIIGGLAKVGDFFNLPLNTERLQKLTQNYIVSNMKIKTALGKQLPFSTREGLQITASSFNVKRTI